MSIRQNFYIVLISVCSIMNVMMSSDLYIPGLPAISDYFGVTSDFAQITLATNLWGIAISGLLYGPLSDSFGRKKTLMLGFGLFVTFTIVCSFSTNIYMLIGARFLQGFGGGSAMVITLAMVKDVFTGNRCTEILARIMMIIAIAPMVAPIIGGYVIDQFNWQASFYLMAIFGMINLIGIYLFLPETNPTSEETKHSVSPAQISRNYKTLIQDKQFMSLAVIHGFLFIGKWSFFTVAPFIFIKVMGIQIHEFGYYMGSIVLGYAFFSLLTQFTVKKIGTEKILYWGIRLGFAGSILLLVFSKFTPDSANLICLSVALYVGAIAMIAPSAANLAMDVHLELKGAAASIVSMFRTMLASVGAVIGSFVEDTTFMSIAILMITLMILLGLLIARVQPATKTA